MYSKKDGKGVYQCGGRERMVDLWQKQGQQKSSEQGRMGEWQEWSLTGRKAELDGADVRWGRALSAGHFTAVVP